MAACASDSPLRLNHSLSGLPNQNKRKMKITIDSTGNYMITGKIDPKQTGSVGHHNQIRPGKLRAENNMSTTPTKIAKVTLLNGNGPCSKMRLRCHAHMTDLEIARHILPDEQKISAHLEFPAHPEILTLVSRENGITSVEYMVWSDPEN